jgi:protein phosphatase
VTILEVLLAGLLVALVAVCALLTILLLRDRSARGSVLEGGAAQPGVSVLPPSHGESDEADVDITRVAPFVVGKQALPTLNDDTDAEDAEASTEESKALLLFEGDSGTGIDEPTGADELILTSSAAKTDRGITRRRNEDSFLIDRDLELYVVADGMGGYAGGDHASRLAVREVREAIRSGERDDTHPDRPRRGAELTAAFERANAAILAEVQKHPELEGMGTTLVAARFSVRKQRVYIGHVGDSRVYRLRGGTLQMLTTDHTLGARGVTGPLASNIRRAVGIGPALKVDLIVDTPRPDDVYLLCSDGLTKMVGDEEIRRILSQPTDDLDRATSSLVAAANARGGRDNITAVLVRVHEITMTRWAPKRQVVRA